MFSSCNEMFITCHHDFLVHELEYTYQCILKFHGKQVYAPDR